MEVNKEFSRVKNVIKSLRNILKCQMCSELKQPDSVLFYRSCDHFYCSECLSSQEVCPLCQVELDKAICIINDKSMLSLYQSLIKLELPSKNDIQVIYESYKKSKECNNDIQDRESSNTKDPEVSNVIDDIKASDNNNIDVTPQNGTKMTTNKKEVRSRKKNAKNLEAALTANITPSNSEESKSKKGRKGKKISVSPGGEENQVLLDQYATPVRDVKEMNQNTNEIGSAKSSSKSNINKKNAKGETKLHIACKKSDFNKAKELIEAGADPNIHDYAGWTPLHESVYAGSRKIIQFLLENGAKINAPGPESTTALHEAIAHGKTEIVKLLMEYGADINAMNVLRETPLGMVKKYDLIEMEEILLSYKPASKATHVEVEEFAETAVIYYQSLPVEHEKLLIKFAEKFSLKIVSSMKEKDEPTHIIVSNTEFDITWGIVYSVLSGCWLVSVKWVEECMKKSTLISAASYQVDDDRFLGFMKARQNKKNMLPGLFCGCHFFFGGNVKTYNVKNVTVSSEDLQRTIEKNGGKILKRCPDPESLSLEKTIPYHADPSGSLKETAYYIIYQTGKWVPPLKYGMAHLKSLPIDWLLVSMIRFELIDPTMLKDPEYFL